MKTEYIYPDKLKLQNDYLIEYGRQFLELNNFNIGDIVEIEFRYEYISRSYRSSEQSKYSCQQICKGVLKLDDIGRLYCESLEDMNFYENESNGRSGRSYKSWYKLVRKKSIVKFGTGFIF